MKIITKIFPNGGYYISSGWGNREFYYNGKLVKDFHNGIDYATYGKKLPQYAVEDGYIVSCGTASDKANYIWVAYPRIGKKFLHYHLDSISVKSGQTVTAGTLLGYTGMTGMATGIHLHLGMKNISGGDYENVENYNYTFEPTPTKSIDELAQEVIAGKWGNNPERKQRLTDAGYDYARVQARVNEILAKPTANYYPAFNNVSIVDGLKSIGVDSSFAYRIKIASKNGISNYTGTAEQNTYLCDLARKGKLIRI